MLRVAVVFPSFTFYFYFFLSFISIDHKAGYLYGLLNPGLSILFNSGPVRIQVQVSAQSERVNSKQTNKHLYIDDEEQKNCP